MEERWERATKLLTEIWRKSKLSPSFSLPLYSVADTQTFVTQGANSDHNFPQGGGKESSVTSRTDKMKRKGSDRQTYRELGRHLGSLSFEGSKSFVLEERIHDRIRKEKALVRLV